MIGFRTAQRALGIAATLVLAACGGGESPTEPEPPPPPPPPPTPFTVPAIEREFRGMWIATVANIDWPSRADLSAAQQQTEMGVLLDAAVAAGLNAVVVQVRPAGDVIYPSTIEPYARSFTGVHGQGPNYDPMGYIVQQARQRGLEVHAWFNPFRAGNLRDTLTMSPQHLSVRRPDLVRKCGQLWYDPAETAVHDQAIAVIREVIGKYDVDAVHIDDFFYPYPDTCTNFPDSVTYRRYQTGGGTLALADWRRDNVNRFVERMYREAHEARASIRVGISPFGIWRPGNPAGIVGLDSYTSIFADSRLWLQRGWVDYFAPQLYWSIASTGQSFPALLSWWGQQNTQRRHLWPGLASYRIGTDPGPFSNTEIPAQVQIIRDGRSGIGAATGSILYNGSSVKNNRGGFATALATGLYSGGAIPPATTWLDNTPPADPGIAVSSGLLATQVTITPTGTDAWWYLVRWRRAGTWRQRLVPATQRTVDIDAIGLEGVVVNAIDRVGNESANVVWRPTS
ncbi:MAG: family 10 glycosylhydrolase [Gemmatimonadaceae bacterium]|nr:family 10 glycosylhydrolase [Gemmatimonadaceae bacterium]